MNKSQLLRELLKQPRYWHVPNGELARMVRCSDGLVSRIKSSLEAQKPVETMTEKWERKILELLENEKWLGSFYTALVTSGTLKNALKFLGPETINALLKEIEDERPTGASSAEVEDSKRMERLHPALAGVQNRDPSQGEE